MERFKVLIVGGCMPIQDKSKGNIKNEEVYLNILKREFLKNHEIILDFEIITYDKLETCLTKIKESDKINNVDILIFQVRSYFYVKMIDVLYKHHIDNQDDNGGMEKVVQNIASRYVSVNDKLKSSRLTLLRVLVLSLKSRIRRLPLRKLIGILVGRESKVKIEYKKLILGVHNYFSDKGVPAIYLGVTSRPNSWLENILSKRINTYSSVLINSFDGQYIDVFGKYDKENQYKFVKGSTLGDIVSLNNIGHKEIADMLMGSIESSISQKAFLKRDTN